MGSSFHPICVVHGADSQHLAVGLQMFAIRDYERTVYVLGACSGAVWGGISLGIMFGFDQSGPVTWLLLWPAWLDLILLRNPSVLQSCVVGVLGVDSVVWILLTVSHLRESAHP